MIRKTQIKISKRRGAALLITVLVAFLMLSVLTMVVFNIAMNISRVERWQTEHYEKVRLAYLARSAVNAAIEAASSDLASLGASSSTPINKQGTISIPDTEAISLDMVISGDASPYLVFKAKAYDGSDQSVTVTAKYDTANKKITKWSGGL
jgi:Tfp pilus assembly protein PilX